MEVAQLNTRKFRPLWYALCFLLPALVLTAVYAAEGFYPFGDKSILVSDMAQQYVEFFCALKNGDLFFSWSKALGTSYIGVFSYYVSSPLSLLTLLVPNEAMPLGLMGLTILKLGLAGLTFAIFSGHCFRQFTPVTVICAVSYALCSYCMAYSLCIMWLDGVIWLPIILLGLERLLAGQGIGLFSLSLAACFLSTWYISYMIGGFCCLWLLFRTCALGLDRRKFVRALRDFLLSALWALCMTAWLWLPSFLAMFTGKFAGATADYPGLFNFDLAELFPQFLFGRFQYFTYTALPLVFCGTLTVPAAAAYFFLPAVPRRERLAAAGVAAVLILSLWLSPLDKVWHLFKYPNWFPYRYSFLLSFFLLFLAQHALVRGLNALRPRLPRLSQAAALLLAALVCCEMGANARIILHGIDEAGGYESYSAYAADYASNAALTAAAVADCEDVFFRMGADADRGMNSPLAFGYYGITHYSSLYNSEVNAALKSLGFAQGWYWCVYYGSTHLTDALLDIRCVISRRAIPGYEAVAGDSGLTLWKNPNVLPLAFSAAGVDVSGSDSPIALQNAVFSALLGEDIAIFTPAVPTLETRGGSTALTFEGNGQPIYIDLTAGGLTSLQVDGEYVSDLNTGETRHLYCLGAPAPGETLTAVITHTSAPDFSSLCWSCSLDLLADAAARLNNTQITAVTNSRVELTLSGGSGPILATTIPAEAGWSAYVDGRRTDLFPWLNAFLALELPAGARTVVLRYTAPGLRAGIAIGAFALLAAVLTPLYRRGRPRR